jgi:hypothetical protein
MRCQDALAKVRASAVLERPPRVGGTEEMMLTKPDQSKAAAPKRYVKPILLKGPVLTSVTALGVVSGAKV